MTRTAVLALGGNAIVREGERGTHEEQYRNAVEMAGIVRTLIRAGWHLAIVHGNGPQVGNLAIQQEGMNDIAPPQPLEAIGAMTQGALGSLLCLALTEVCGDEIRGVVSVVTHTLVDEDDPAFGNPTKPIGPFFDRVEVDELERTRGWTMRDDAGRGFRRVVPSPHPVGIVEAAPITRLIDDGYLVVAAGGGGVPVVGDGLGHLRGVAAVIDKDHAAERLATGIGADVLAIVTGVSSVRLDFRTPAERPISDLTVTQARKHLRDGQFPAGSMGPKVEAAARFASTPDRLAVITSPELVVATLDPDVPAEERGTRVRA